MNRYYIDSKRSETTVRLVDDPSSGIMHGQIVHAKTGGKAYKVNKFDITYKPAAPEHYTTDRTSGLRWLKAASSTPTSSSTYSILWSPEIEGTAELVNPLNTEDRHVVTFDELFENYNCVLSWWV